MFFRSLVVLDLFFFFALFPQKKIIQNTYDKKDCIVAIIAHVLRILKQIENTKEGKREKFMEFSRMVLCDTSYVCMIMNNYWLDKRKNAQ